MQHVAKISSKEGAEIEVREEKAIIEEESATCCKNLF